MTPFTLSIETDAGTYVHGFHLGTDELVAKKIAMDVFENLIPKIGKTIRTVALMRDGRMFDCFVGNYWTGERKWG